MHSSTSTVCAAPWNERRRIWPNQIECIALRGMPVKRDEMNEMVDGCSAKGQWASIRCSIILVIMNYLNATSVAACFWAAAISVSTSAWHEVCLIQFKWFFIHNAKSLFIYFFFAFSETSERKSYCSVFRIFVLFRYSQIVWRIKRKVGR